MGKSVKRVAVRPLRHIAVVALAALAVSVPTAIASHDYWDYHNYLCAGCSYGEGQAGTSGFWYLRVSQNTTNVNGWLRRRENNNWEWLGANEDFTVEYPLSTFNASRATNGSGCCQYFVNVRIDGAV